MTKRNSSPAYFAARKNRKELSLLVAVLFLISLFASFFAPVRSTLRADEEEEGTSYSSAVEDTSVPEDSEEETDYGKQEEPEDSGDPDADEPSDVTDHDSGEDSTESPEDVPEENTDLSEETTIPEESPDDPDQTEESAPEEFTISDDPSDVPEDPADMPSDPAELPDDTSTVPEVVPGIPSDPSDPEDEPPASSSQEDISETSSEDPETEDDPVDRGVRVFRGETSSGIRIVVVADRDSWPTAVYMCVQDVEASDILDIVNSSIDPQQEVKEAVAVDISFLDENGNEIEPNPDASISVSIELPASTMPEGDDLSLIHISDGNDATEITEKDISEQTVTFETDSFSIFVLTALGERSKDEINEYLYYLDHQYGYRPNSYNDPYILNQGDTLTLVGYSTDSNVDFGGDYLTSGMISRVGDPIRSYDNEKNMWRVEQTFRANENISGTTSISLNPWHGNDDTIFIHVNTLTPKTHTVNFDEVQNSSPYNPIHIHIGDEIRLIGTPYGDNYFYFTNAGGQYQQGGSNHASDFYDVEHTYNTHVEETFLALGYGNDVFGVGLQVGQNNQYKTIYFVVDDRPILDHADIEVEDGGVYTATRIYTDGSTVKKTVTRYQSFVSNVHECILYDENGDGVTFYSSHEGNSNNIDGFLPGVHGYSGSRSLEDPNSGDYWQDPSIRPGDSQYELTSKYIGLGNGQYDHWSQKKFYAGDVDHARFDVELQLQLIDETTYTRVGDEWVDPVYTPATGNEERKTIDSVIFELDKTAVVDAYNKCPNHSGLDFTIKSSTAIVEIEAGKELYNGSLVGGEFTFEIYDPSSETVVATAVNTADGQVLFDGLHFEVPGTYQYIIREVNDHQENIKYDDTEYIVTIVAERDQSGEIYAEVIGITYSDGQPLPDGQTLKFYNRVGFTLPETGGSGVILYEAAGLLMILASATGYLIRRRKRKREVPEIEDST